MHLCNCQVIPISVVTFFGCTAWITSSLFSHFLCFCFVYLNKFCVNSSIEWTKQIELSFLLNFACFCVCVWMCMCQCGCNGIKIPPCSISNEEKTQENVSWKEPMKKWKFSLICTKFCVFVSNCKIGIKWPYATCTYFQLEKSNNNKLLLLNK